MEKKKASAARIKANAKYNSKAYDRLELKVFKGNKAKIKEYCDNKGISVNAFINQLVYERMAADGYELATAPTANSTDI